MKLFMHWDMEGTSGLFTREHVWFWEEQVRPQVADEGHELLMADVNAAARAALAAGADQLIVCDTHHGGGNLVLDRMLADPRIRYLERSVGREAGRRRWMPGLDESVDGLLLLGHHAKAGTPGAFLPHTWMLEWADFQINGQSVGEIGIETCYAGHWDIPLILVQADEAGCREAQAQHPGVMTAAVKRAESHDRAAGLEAEAARRLTADRIAQAIAKLRTAKPRPFKPTLPMTVTVRLTTRAAADAIAAKPGVRRVDEFTVQATLARQCEVVQWITGHSPDMPEPPQR